MKIHNITGPPVEGDDFFGRENELKFAWNLIDQGNSIILSAPRRVGKSSFGKKLIAIAKKQNWNTIELNLEEIKSEASFITLFVETIKNESWWEKLKDRGNNIADSILGSIKPSFEIEGVKTSIELEWKSKRVDIYEKLKSLLDPKKETLIMVDELTVLLNSFIKNNENGKDDVEFFLNWLRGFRQKTGTKIRWVFCSSVSIENFTNRYALSYTFNDVENMPIGPFSEQQSLKFINLLVNSIDLKIDNKLENYLLQKIGWYLPYFIQIMINKVHYKVSVNEMTLDENCIDMAYQDLIDGKNLNTWDERLKEYSDMEDYARLVLKHLCKIKEGDSRSNLVNKLTSKIQDMDKCDDILSKLLYMLKNDGYIMEHDSKYVFRSPFLRDFWFKRFVL